MVATQRDDLSVEMVNDEMLVFNPARGEATALNQSAALVFGLCDGSNSIESMKTALEGVGLDPASDDAVWLALGELADAGLIDLHVERPRHRGRRELLKQFGVGAAALAALPVVETIKAPSVAAQGSPMAPTTTSTTTTTVATPSPTQPTPSPSQPTPSPTYQTPSPTYQTPSPTYQTPSPTYQTPSPTYQTMAPSPSPTARPTAAPSPSPTPGPTARPA